MGQQQLAPRRSPPEAPEEEVLTDEQPGCSLSLVAPLRRCGGEPPNLSRSDPPHHTHSSEDPMPSKLVMGKYKAGKLHSGSKSGPLVKSRPQAIAIMMSERKNEDVDADEQPQRHAKPKRKKA
jgi:hypothetical protein